MPSTVFPNSFVKHKYQKQNANFDFRAHGNSKQLVQNHQEIPAVLLNIESKPRAEKWDPEAIAMVLQG